MKFEYMKAVQYLRMSILCLTKYEHFQFVITSLIGQVGNLSTSLVFRKCPELKSITPNLSDKSRDVIRESSILHSSAL